MAINLVSDTIDREDIAGLINWLHQKEIPQLTKGPITKEYESKFSNWLGTNHSVFVNSGSSAILLGLTALKFGGKLKNNKIVVPDVSWATDVSTPLILGMDTFVVDCNREDLSADLDHLESIFREENPAAFILVSVLGLVPDMDRIVSLCEKYNVLLIEDTCESMGSEYKGQKLGTFGCMSFFSTYFGHHISTIEGGLISTNNKDINDMLLMIRSHGWDRDLDDDTATKLAEKHNVKDFDRLFTFYMPGLNVRSTDLQAKIGLSQVDKIDKFAKIRNDNFLNYNDRLKYSANLISPTQREGDFVSSFCYPIILQERNKCIAELRANDIACRPLIAGSLTKSPMWKKFGGMEVNNPNAIFVNDYGFYCPNHQGLSDTDIERICDIIIKY
ncbi:DegT/DnrJ/EryC1/StrS aminotransferase family protein [bacterium]|nr:DegT/DnrJ/EryC1/StrS aminotransferase family protein [bacterium]